MKEGTKRSPETIEKMRAAQLGFDPAALTEREWDDFTICRQKGGMSVAEALRAIKRADLVRVAAE
jgi:hypothetical protein